MFKRFRVFWFVALPSFALSCVMLLYYPFFLRSDFNMEIIKEAQEDSKKVARYFINQYLTELLDYDSSIPRKLEKAITRDINTFDLWKVRLFSSGGNIVYSSKKSEIGDVNTKPYFTGIVAKGQVYTKIVKKAAMTECGTVTPYDVVETYVPIMVSGNFMGAFEIYVNVTEQMNRLKILFWHSYAVIASVTVLFLFLIAWFSLRIDRATRQRERIIGELEDALAEIKTLRGIVPICTSCKKIRDDGGYWHQVESYVRDHSEAEFSHSICPECAKNLYPDLVKDKE